MNRELAERISGGRDCGFVLDAPGKAVSASGVAAMLPSGPIATLDARVAAFFAAHPSGPRVVVGAVPYDREAADCLFQPQSLCFDEGIALHPSAPAPVAAWDVTPEPDVAQYCAAVDAALTRIGEAGGALSKVVLSRSLRLHAAHRIDPAPLLAALRLDASVTVFSTPVSDPRAGAARLIGATPELLVSRRDGIVASHPLAGTLPRGGDPVSDRAAGAALLASIKDRHEHALVVEAVLDALAPFCDRLTAPEGPDLRGTATMWHLGTRIEGALRDPETPVAALLAALHPTPAVCGMPRAAADAALRELEGYDRGFYAGAVGWADEAGDGEWYVALRCAEIEGASARLFAGAGIVAGSEPEAEAMETSAKFLAMLRAFGIDETGHPLRRSAA